MRTALRTMAAALLALALVLPAWSVADEAADKAERTARREAMLAAGRAAFCRVHFFFKRPADMKERQPASPYGFDEEMFSRLPYEALINQQRSLVVAGLLLDDKGHVLIGDFALDAKYVDRVEVAAPDGTRYPAQLDRILDRTAGVILTIGQPLKNWKAPVFTSQAAFDDPHGVGVVTMRRVGREWFLALGSAGMEYAYEQGIPAPRRFAGAGLGMLEELASGAFFNPFESSGDELMTGMLAAQCQPMLLCNEKGQPVGALTSAFPVDPEQKLGDWQQERLLAGPGITFAELRDMAAKCDEKLAGKAYKCVIQYRREEGEGRHGTEFTNMMPFGSRMNRGRPGANDREEFGLAFSARQVLVPQPLTREELANVEKIEIVVGDKPQPAEFVAVLKDMSGFILSLKEGALPAYAAITPRQAPERLALFLTATLEEKSGKAHAELKPNRWLHEQRGYKDLYYISPAHPLSGGGWILDRNLDVLGVLAGQRVLGEEIQELGAAGRGMYGDFTRYPRRIFWAGELAPMLTNPTAFADPQIRPKSRDEAKRLVWLGVESSPMTPELARQLKVEKATKDGTIGFYVNLVYRNSPAERMGIKDGDILLQIETAKRPHPIDLGAAGMNAEMFHFDWRQYADYTTVEEYGDGQPRWPIQLNPLTMLLQSIGEGEKVKVIRLHGAETITKDYQIELGPPNFLCAPKYKNKEIGLTVRDVTYEVRAALRLEDAQKAVVVSKIERGSPAEVARVAPFELITAIDGAPVASAEEFAKRIKEAQEAGKKSVRLTVELLGTSRLADLEITGAAVQKEKTQE